MKITHVIGSLCPGGAERVTVNLCCELSRLGHSVKMIAIDEWSGSPFECRAIEALQARGIQVLSLHRKPGTGWRGFHVVPRLAAEMRRAPSDIIHSHLLLAHTITSLAVRLGRSAVSHVATVHSSREPWGRSRSMLIGKPFLAYCSNAAQAAGRHSGKREAVIPNGIELNIPSRSSQGVEELRREFGLSQCCKIVISVGRLKQAKNYHAAIQAFCLAASRSQAHYLIIGGGEKASFMSLADSCPKPSRVLFLGERDDVSRLLQAADCYFSASEYEGMPVAVLEALAHGLPCVLSPIAEHMEIAAGLPGCHFSETNTAESLANALQSALARPHDKSGLREARMPMLACYDIRMCAQSYCDLYLRALGANPFMPGHDAPVRGKSTARAFRPEALLHPSSPNTTGKR